MLYRLLSGTSSLNVPHPGLLPLHLCLVSAPPTPFDKKLAAFIRQKRGEIPYRTFARQLGMHRSTLHRLEHGEQSITLGMLHQIMRKLKCRFSDIFGSDDPIDK